MQVSAKWLQPKFFGSNVQELTKENTCGYLDPAAFFVGLLQMWMTTSSQCWTVKTWNKNPNDAHLLSCWIFFFSSTWMGPDTEGTKMLLTLQYFLTMDLKNNWWAPLAKKIKSEHETGKIIFSSLRLPTHWAKRWEKGRYTKEMLHPTEMCSVFYSYSWWGWKSCSLSLRGVKKV